MERKGILYLGNRTLPSLENLEIYSRLNNYSLFFTDEEDFDPLRPQWEKDIHLILIDFPLRSRTRVKDIGELKKRRNLPLIMLMTSVKESAQIEAFSQGADDILDRKIASDNGLTLINRIGNLIKLYGGRDGIDRKSWKTGKDILSLDLSGRLASLNGATVHLTPTEWSILRLLSEKNGQVVTREKILASCFEYQYEGYDRSIDAHIKNLRKKIPGCVETMRGVGYHFSGKEI